MINDIQLSVNSTDGTPQKARYIRIELAGKGQMLQLAEVEVFSAGKNIARAGKATQSSTDFGGPPHLAIDGNPDGTFTNKSVTHTKVEANPWWELDLIR